MWGVFLSVPHWRGDLSFLDRIEAPLADLRFLVQGQRRAPDQIAIVAIDDETVRQSGAYPLPRVTVANLIERIAALRPKVIAVDILLLDPGPSEGDRLLAEALRLAPAVLAAAGLFESSLQSVPTPGRQGLNGVPTAAGLLLPLERFARAAAVGTVNLATDRGGTPRHVPLLLRSGSQLTTSFPLRTASVAIGRDPVLGPDQIGLGDRVISTDLGFALPIRFYGPQGTIRTISASRVLSGQIDEDSVGDRIVVVGATVTGGGDVFPTPFDPVLPGVEVLATALGHLMTGDGLLRDWRVRAVDVAAAVSLPAMLVLLLAWHRSGVALILVAVAVLFWIGVTTAAFMQGVWLSAALPIAAAAPPAIIYGATQLWLDRGRADTLAREQGTLRRFQPPSLRDRLARDPDFLVEPVRQEAAVVFVDLSGFTGLSQAFGPDETRALLKDFHSLVDEEAVRCHGLVASFMGDGAMILFGLPEPTPQDACHAVEVCTKLCFRLSAWLASLPGPTASRLNFKIGAHYGPIVASRLGGDTYQHITAIGDTVNVASRLMEVAAAHEAEVALSDELYRAAGSGCSVFNDGILEGVVDTPIRGRSGALPVRLWRSKMTTVAEAGYRP